MRSDVLVAPYTHLFYIFAGECKVVSSYCFDTYFLDYEISIFYMFISHLGFLFCEGLVQAFPYFSSFCLFVCLLIVVEIFIYSGHFVRPFSVVSVVKTSFVTPLYGVP